MEEMSVDPYRRLVKLVARAFYDDMPLKGENQQKNSRGDNRGIAVVILDALTRHEWVREEDLAKILKLHSKQLRRTLRYFEEENLVTRDHRKETAKGAQRYSKAVAATDNGHHNGKEGEEKIKLHTHSYCCLDYSQIYDIVRYRMHHMKKKLKDELENRNAVQEYLCPECGRRYTAFDAAQLMSALDESFHCANCNGELVAEDQLAGEEMGDGGDNSRRRRREKLKDMLLKMEGQLKPLTEQLNRIKDLAVPEFRTLRAWEEATNHATNDDLSSNDPADSDGKGLGGIPWPLPGDFKVEEDNNHGAETVKVLPPWMIKQGMVLTKEQRGVVIGESTADNKSTRLELSDDRKSEVNEDGKSILQDEYIKAYYAAILKRQQELEEAAKRNQQGFVHIDDPSNPQSEASDRQVGMKSKRGEDDQDDDVEWEEAPTAGTTTLTHKVHGLNVPAEESGDDEDDIDWEEG